MELLRFDSMEALDFPRLMSVYRESNTENIPCFFPGETDPGRGLRQVESRFGEYLRTDFFAAPDNRYYVLEEGL